jgi:chromosome segregation ATPase
MADVQSCSGRCKALEEQAERKSVFFNKYLREKESEIGHLIAEKTAQELTFSESMEDIRKAISDMKSEMKGNQKYIHKLEQKVAVLEQGRASDQEQVCKLEQERASDQEHVCKLEQKVAVLEQERASDQEHVCKLEQKLAVLEQYIETNEIYVAKLNEHIEQLEERLVVVENVENVIL